MSKKTQAITKVSHMQGVAYAALAALTLSVLPAMADDWQAVRLRGDVYALDNGQWQKLERGDVVSDSRMIRTAANGHVRFIRDQESIDLDPNTQIQIYDRNGQRFTVIQEHFGSVAVEAEHRNVQHFAVQTPYLAAVVKGTRFVVDSNDKGAEVDVTRGLVEVRDALRHQMTQVRAGQSAKMSANNPLSVAGDGVISPVIGFVGSAYAMTADTAGAQGQAASGNANAGAGNNNAGGNGNGNSNAGSGNSNAGGNGNGNSNAGSGNSNAGGNGNGKAKGLDKSASVNVGVGNGSVNANVNAGGLSINVSL